MSLALPGPRLQHCCSFARTAGMHAGIAVARVATSGYSTTHTESVFNTANSLIMTLLPQTNVAPSPADAAASMPMHRNAPDSRERLFRLRAQFVLSNEIDDTGFGTRCTTDASASGSFPISCAYAGSHPDTQLAQGRGLRCAHSPAEWTSCDLRYRVQKAQKGRCTWFARVHFIRQTKTSSIIKYNRRRTLLAAQRPGGKTRH